MRRSRSRMKRLRNSLLLLVGRRHQQAGEQRIDVARGRAAARRRDRRRRSPPSGRTRSTASACRRLGLERHVDDRRAAGQRQLDDLAGPAAAARRQAVPHRDQHVAMRDGRAAGHHISVEAVRPGRRAARAGRPRARAARRTARARRRWRGLRDRSRARTAGSPAAPSRARARPRRRSGRRRRRSARRTAAAAAPARSSRARVRAASRPRRSISSSVSRMRSRSAVDSSCGEHLGAVAGHADAEDERDGRRSDPRAPTPPTRLRLNRIVSLHPGHAEDPTRRLRSSPIGVEAAHSADLSLSHCHSGATRGSKLSAHIAKNSFLVMLVIDHRQRVVSCVVRRSWTRHMPIDAVAGAPVHSIAVCGSNTSVVHRTVGLALAKQCFAPLVL